MDKLKEIGQGIVKGVGQREGQLGLLYKKTTAHHPAAGNKGNWKYLMFIIYIYENAHWLPHDCLVHAICSWCRTIHQGDWYRENVFHLVFLEVSFLHFQNMSSYWHETYHIRGAPFVLWVIFKIPFPKSLMVAAHKRLLLLPGTSFPFLQDLLAGVLGLWLIYLLEHYKIDPMLTVDQFILNK